jgi:hypothetical protein
MFKPIILGVSRNSISIFEGGLVQISSITSILNYYKVMESPHSCILNVQATIATSSSSMSTSCGPCFFDYVLPFKWFEEEVRGMCQCFFVFFKVVCPLCITSIVFFQTFSCPFGSLVWGKNLIRCFYLLWLCCRKDILFIFICC